MVDEIVNNATGANYFWIKRVRGVTYTNHSQRMAVIGSIRAAWMAGSREAALAIVASATTELSRIQGSCGEVS